MADSKRQLVIGCIAGIVIPMTILITCILVGERKNNLNQLRTMAAVGCIKSDAIHDDDLVLQNLTLDEDWLRGMRQSGIAVKWRRSGNTLIFWLEGKSHGYRERVTVDPQCSVVLTK